MAARYWVGGVANYNAANAWSATNGGAGGASTPGTSDDVLATSTPATYWAALTALSLTNYRAPTIANGFAYEVTTAGITGATEPTWPTTIGATVTNGTVVFTCRRAAITVSVAGNFSTLDFTGYTGTFVVNNILSTISGGGAARSATFSSTMALSGSSRIAFSSGGDATVTSNGLTIPIEIRLNNGGTFILGSDLTYTSAFSNSLAGTSFNFNGYNLTCTNWNFPSIGTLTMASPSVLTVTGNTFTGSSKAYATVNLTVSGVLAISGTNTFTDLSRTSNSTTATFNLAANQTITGLLTLSGATAVNRLYVVSSARGTARTLTAASVSIQYCDFEDITGAGAAAPFTGTSLGNCYGNSGITFTTPVDRYWVGGTGNWSQTARWSATSGGASGASIPLPQDYAYINANSGTSTSYLLNLPRICSLNTTGKPSNAVTLGVNNLGLYGDFIGSIDNNGAFSTVFLAGRGSHSISGGGINNGVNLNIDSVTGSYTAIGNINLSNAVTLNLNSGTFNASIYTITTGSFASSNSITRTLNMGSGLWVVTRSSTGTAWNFTTTTGLTFNKDSADIELRSSSNSITRTFIGGGKSYNKLIISGAAGTGQITTITGSNTFTEIASTKTLAHTINLTAGTTTTVTNWTASGLSGNLLTLKSATAAAATLAKAGGGTVTIDYANISYITGSPINTWYATNSTDSGNNTNVYFTSPPSSNNSSFLMLF